MDDLLDRIAQGMTTERDARTVSKMIARLVDYELVLREIAVYGQGEPAMRAAHVLAEAETCQAAEKH